ncbi:protein LAZ1-like [Asparagus officinalis]|uniref:protein LAZ1-like n=1 Tax=Asparagus officinalis TaxID=4686 RepID=UPI00098E0A90|nr:protein LAZ1-like [Asparagus officinalis]
MCMPSAFCIHAVHLLCEIYKCLHVWEHLTIHKISLAVHVWEHLTIQMVTWGDSLYPFLAAYSPPQWATAIAGVFVVVSLSLPTHLLFQHLSAYKNPEEQKFLVGVILMVPCYAIESVQK